MRALSANLGTRMYANVHHCSRAELNRGLLTEKAHVTLMYIYIYIYIYGIKLTLINS